MSKDNYLHNPWLRKPTCCDAQISAVARCSVCGMDLCPDHVLTVGEWSCTDPACSAVVLLQGMNK